MTAWRLLLTRPAEESEVLARTLASEGVFSRSLPLLQIQPLPLSHGQLAPLRALEGLAVVIVVSKSAARLALQWLAEQGLPATAPSWFAVGAGTAQVLRERGIDAQFPSQGDDSEALLRLPALRERLQGAQRRVLILRGEGGREWLGEQLQGLGATVEYLQLYRRQLPDYPANALHHLIEAERLNGVVVSSGQGFDNLLQLAGADTSLLCRLPLFVPSQRVADMATAAGVNQVFNCAGASAAALSEALRRYPAPSAPATPDKNA